jgi:hypothetical protein
MASRQAGESVCSTQSIKSTNGLDDLWGQAFRPVGEFFNSVLAHLVLYRLHTNDSKANTIGAGEIRLRSHTDTHVIVAAKHCPTLSHGTITVITRTRTAWQFRSDADGRRSPIAPVILPSVGIVKNGSSARLHEEAGNRRGRQPMRQILRCRRTRIQPIKAPAK